MHPLFRLIAGLLIFASSAAALAQAYPSRPIRFIVPFAAGGISDAAARVVGQKLTERWGQQVVVENRTGAGGTIGTDIAAKAKPDGYTLLMGSSTELALNPNLYRKLPYDTTRDFVPIALVGYAPLLMVVHPSLPVRSPKDFEMLAKSRPGELNYASTGNGSTVHVASEMFRRAAGIDMVHVPATTTALTSVLSGHTQLMLSSIPTSYGQVQAGKLRALAVTSEKRFPLIPQLPTLVESGYPSVVIVIWNALVAPAGTPREITDRLSEGVMEILKNPETKTAFGKFNVELLPGGPEQLGAFIKSELAKFSKVTREAGIQLD